jgi:trypsin
LVNPQILISLFRFVNLVCTPDDQAAPDEGTTCWITGFGAISPSGWLPNYLRQAIVPIVGRSRCEKAYPGRLHDAMICGGYDSGGVDSCQGDSGGPLVCETGGRYFIHGVTSWGVGCGSAGYYGVYAKVTHFMNWIKKEIVSN